MSETNHLKLYVTDDATTSFIDFRTNLAGVENSNMVKIDEAIGSLDAEMLAAKDSIAANASAAEEAKQAASSAATAAEEAQTEMRDAVEQMHSDLDTAVAQMDSDIGTAIEQMNDNLSSAKTEMGEQVNDAISVVNTNLENKADKSGNVQTILAAENWTGSAAPYTQEVAVTGLTTDQNGTVSVAASASAEQREAARNAILSVTGQGDGTLTICADGELPTVNIPITVILLG